MCVGKYANHYQPIMYVLFEVIKKSVNTCHIGTVEVVQAVRASSQNLTNHQKKCYTEVTRFKYMPLIVGWLTVLQLTYWKSIKSDQ